MGPLLQSLHFEGRPMKKKTIIAMIPARMAATRFPNKPMAKILGLSMIEHVRRRAMLCDFFDDVIVATCDEEIKKEVEANGGKVIMTGDHHQRCTDRIEEAAKKIEADIIVNIQGDEPAVLPKTLRALIQPLLDDSSIKSTNIINPINNINDLKSENVVKAAISRSLNILYMSRSVLPGYEFQSDCNYFKQTGIIAFRKDALHLFSSLEPTPLEVKESVDMLRFLENDIKVQGVISENISVGVDVPEQIKEMEEYILNDEDQKVIYEQIK